MNIIVFGDSITQGFDDTAYGGWVNRLFVAVSARSRGQEHGAYHAVFNLGISGDTTDALGKRMAGELSARAGTENLIVFDIGGNDSVRHVTSGECQVPLERFTANYRWMIAHAQQYGTVVCLGIHDSDESVLKPLPWYPEYASLDEDGQRYDEAIQGVADEGGALYISMRNILNKDFETYTYDGDHPSAEGHRLIYERVKDGLEQAGIL